MRDQAVLQPQHEQEGQTDALPNGLDRPSHLLLGYNDVRVKRFVDREILDRVYPQQRAAPCLAISGAELLSSGVALRGAGQWKWEFVDCVRRIQIHQSVGRLGHHASW